MADVETKSPPVETRSGESPAAAHVASSENGADPGATETEKGNRYFLRRVQEIPGVVHVEPIGGSHISEQSFIVYVGDGDIAAEYGVYGVKGEVYDRYPGAQLRVEVLEESDLPEGGRGIAVPGP
jgi:hypothetical protein